MFEMSSVSSSTEDSQSLVSFPDYTVNHSLVKTVPLLVDTLPQLFHILQLVPVNSANVWNSAVCGSSNEGDVCVCIDGDAVAMSNTAATVCSTFSCPNWFIVNNS